MLRVVAPGVALLIALAPAGAVFAREADRGGEPRSTVAKAGSLDEVPLYYAGNLVDGLPLVAMLRRDDTARYVAFVYGDCTPTPDSGCAPPAEIQVWPACRRNLALYQGSTLGPQVDWTSIRGVPAASLDDGTRLELQTGRSTIVVFADSPARVRRIADALRPLNGSGPPGAELPQPAPGAVEGMVEC